MNRIEIIKELLGDNMSEIVSSELKEAYNDLQDHMNHYDDVTPIFSYNKEEEFTQINKLKEAMALVYTYYATNNIED